MSQDTVDLSIIIPCYNSANTIEKCLATVYNQTILSQFNYEILVIDNNSTDETKCLAAKQPNVQVYDETKQGRSHARNRGIEIFKGKYVVFLDSDTYLTPTWLEDVFEATKWDPDRWGLITSIIMKLKTDDSLFERVRASSLKEVNSLKAINRNMPYVNSAALLVRSEALKKIGGFDPFFNYFEDIDFGRRMGLAGYSLIASEAKVSCIFGMTYIKYLIRNMQVGGMCFKFIHRWENKGFSKTLWESTKFILSSIVFVFRTDSKLISKLFLINSKIFELIGIYYTAFFDSSYRTVTPIEPQKGVIKIVSLERIVLYNLLKSSFIVTRR